MSKHEKIFVGVLLTIIAIEAKIIKDLDEINGELKNSRKQWVRAAKEMVQYAPPSVSSRVRTNLRFEAITRRFEE